jgi:hypothetical protein
MKSSMIVHGSSLHQALGRKIFEIPLHNENLFSFRLHIKSRFCRCAESPTHGSYGLKSASDSDHHNVQVLVQQPNEKQTQTPTERSLFVSFEQFEVSQFTNHKLRFILGFLT